MGRRAQRQHWQARTGAQNPDVPGVWGGEQPLVPWHCTVPLCRVPPAGSAGKACPRELGQGWISVAFMGFVSSPQGGIVGSNRSGTGKISGLSMNQRGRNENPLLPNFPRLALLPDEPLPCQMQEKNVPPPP